EIGVRKDRFSGAEGIRKGARHNLRLMFVGCDVNVSCADQFNHLLGTHETVAKDHIAFDSEIVRQLLQVNTVFVALTPQDMRVSGAGNHVNDIAVTRQDFWESLNDVFYALIRREQAKRE